MASQQIPCVESIFTGYRYYDSAQVEVRFPFGYGLAYTRFAYHNLHVGTERSEGLYAALRPRERRGASGEGDCAGVRRMRLRPRRLSPQQELVAFTKVQLDADETQQVVLALDE